MYANESSMALFLVLWGVWAVIGLGLYIWYLAALAALFPRIGLSSGEGWIPVWNESRLLQRGGFSPWLVLLMFVPGVSIAFVVVRIIAISRIHTELGKGAGLTVLALLIPPLWATMLASQLRAEGRTAAPGVAGSAQAYLPAPHQGSPTPFQGNAYQPSAAYPQTAAPSPWAAPPAVPFQPEAPARGSQDFAAPTAAAASGFSSPEAQGAPQQPVAPAAPSFESLGFDSLIGRAADDAGAPAGQRPPAPTHQDPAPAAPPTQWGFGRETEEAYQQLATQEIQPLTAAFSGEPQAVEPFTWPGTLADVPQAPRAAEPFAVPASAWAAPSLPTEAAQAPEQLPVPEQSLPPAQVAAPEPAPAPEQAPEHAPAPEQDPAAQQDPASAPAVEATIVTTPPIVPVVLDAASAAQEEPAQDDELDHTVLVSRAPRERWILELPDGSLLPLPSNDVIVGRRPTSEGESSVLVIPDATRTLSKSHVRLHVIDGAWVVTDLASTNGLAVIDEAGEELVVAPGVSEPATEEMMFGTLRVRLRLIALDG